MRVSRAFLLIRNFSRDNKLQLFYFPPTSTTPHNLRLVAGSGTTATAMANMSKYENIMWEKEMKDQICSSCYTSTRLLFLETLTQLVHARFLYSRELTLDCLMDVINSTDKPPGCSFDVYKSHVVTVNAPTSNAWRVLLSSSESTSLGESLEETLQILQERLRPRLRKSLCTYFQRALLCTANAICL